MSKHKGLGVGFAIAAGMLGILAYSMFQNGNEFDTVTPDLDKISRELTSSVPSVKTISLYIDDLPFGVDAKYANSVREATAEWEKVNTQITFRESGLQSTDIHVQWIKEFGGHPLGQVVKKDFVQIGLGDSLCLGKWRPYTYETVLLIAKHEFGHVLGLEHSSDPSSVMYHTTITKYEVDIDETDFIPDGAIRAYPVCTKEDTASYTFAITSDAPLNIYVVPTRHDYDLFAAGETFTHYPSCQDNEVTFYQKTCAVPSGSLIVLQIPLLSV